jgi:hypothetical protein
MDRLLIPLLFAGTLALAGAPAQAESLRCNGSSAAEGDSRVSVLYKCGRPLLADSYCAPVVYAQTLQPVPDAVAAAFVPCQPVEEWVYDRGPGNLVATVRFRAGVVQSIRYSHAPQ